MSKTAAHSTAKTLSKDVNYGLTVPVLLVTFGILMVFLRTMNYTHFWPYALVVATLVAYADIEVIQPQKRRQLVCLGTPTGYWANPGFYFLFLVCSFDPNEEQTLEAEDVPIDDFVCLSQNNRAMRIKGNGDYTITDSDKFRHYNASQMLINLKAIVERALTRYCAQHKHTALPLKDIGNEILHSDNAFKNDCTKFGVTFDNLIAQAIPQDLQLANLMSFAAEQRAELYATYPTGYAFTKEERKEIEDQVTVLVGITQKFLNPGGITVASVSKK